MSTLLLGLAFLWMLLGMAAVGYGLGRHRGLEDARKELNEDQTRLSGGSR